MSTHITNGGLPSDETNSRTPLVALTIAGLDPSGGAGIIADIKTFTRFGCFATAAVTSLTFQNTTGVFGATHPTAEEVRRQVLPIIEDFTVAAAKTGMLPTAETIRAVARLFREENLPAPVVDPVVRSTSGYDLIDDEALRVLCEELLPLASVATPNIAEAERIAGIEIKDESDMRLAAKLMRERFGARAVLVKGGDMRKLKVESRRAKDGEQKSEGELGTTNDFAIDVLDNEGAVTVFRASRIETNATHGTGCTLAAAIAACLGRGIALEQSVAIAKRFVHEAIESAPRIGHGASPINHNIAPRFDLSLEKDSFA